MTAVGLAARRVKLRPPPVASVEGGSTVQQKSKNYKIRHAGKNTKRLEQVDTPEKLKTLKTKHLKEEIKSDHKRNKRRITKTSDKPS